MTPAAHATAASDLLAVPASPGDWVTPTKNARLAVVHALLAGKAGTGTNYTTAENELAAAEATGGTDANLARAHAFALLAS